MPADPALFGEFYIHPVLDVQKSKEQDRPIYNDKIYIEIKIKGQKNSSFSRVMKESDKQDFPIAWAKFNEENDLNLKSGTPIKALPGVTPSVELELKSFGITTVEDMAILNDAGLDNIRGARSLQQRAKAYMAAVEVKTEPKPEIKPDDPVNVEELEASGEVIKKPKRGRPKKVA